MRTWYWKEFISKSPTIFKSFEALNKIQIMLEKTVKSIICVLFVLKKNHDSWKYYLVMIRRRICYFNDLPYFAINRICHSPFCVPAKLIKLVGLTRPPFLSPIDSVDLIDLIIFAGTQNGEYKIAVKISKPKTNLIKTQLF